MNYLPIIIVKYIVNILNRNILIIINGHMNFIHDIFFNKNNLNLIQ